MTHPYNEKFFRLETITALQGAAFILPWVFARYRHDSVVDVGCGTGAWLLVARQLGSERVVGIDADWAPSRLAHIERMTIDLESAYSLDEAMPSVRVSRNGQITRESVQYDLAICLEVAEHLPAHRADWLVDELARLSDVVLWSAAIPGQGGDGHINERPHAHWRDLWAARGYIEQQWVRHAVEKTSIPVWYRQNVTIFQR
jgi:SAM-dependent methyltransferase